MWYKLDKNNRPLPCRNAVEHIRWESKNPDRKVVKQQHIGDTYISTVFLGLDHAYGGKKPILWETMIFGGKHDQYQVRYASYDDAVKGHEIAVKLVKQEKHGLFHSIWSWISNGCGLYNKRTKTIR
jgi:hypothetical protein